MALLSGTDAPAANLDDHLATHTGAFYSDSCGERGKVDLTIVWAKDE